jgi:hypothetical protein
MLGCPISKQYGGFGYDFRTYVMALQRIGMEGRSLRTFFSAHISIDQLILQNWASIEQKNYSCHSLLKANLLWLLLYQNHLLVAIHLL